MTGPNHNAKYVAVEATELSPRERETACLIADGHSTRTMADLMHVSTHTVEAYRMGIKRKLGFHSEALIARYCIRQGWVTP